MGYRTALVVVALAAAAHAQIPCDPTASYSTTTNLGLYKPAYRYCRPDVKLNLNFDTLDAAVGCFSSSGTTSCTTYADTLLGATTGTKVGFWGTTPVTQSGASCGANANIRACLAGLGLISGTNSLNIGSGTGTMASLAVGTITITGGNDINTGTSTGSNFGSTASQKIGFWGATPAAQSTNCGSGSDLYTCLLGLGLNAGGANTLVLGSGTLEGKLANHTSGSTNSLTADNQTVSDTGTVRISSDNTTATNRTFNIPACTYAGEYRNLIGVMTGANTAELVDDAANSTTGNVRLASTWTVTQYDTLTLICHTAGGDWYEVARSAN